MLILINLLFRLIWWHIIDVSDLKIAQDFLSEAKLNFKISSTLNIEKSVDDWIVLRPTAERCLQFLSKVNYDNKVFDFLVILFTYTVDS